MRATRSVFPALAAAAGALILPAESGAQLASGYSGSSSTSYMDGVEFWRTLRSFGACYAKESEANALGLLATEPDSKAEAAFYKSIIRGDRDQPCLSETSMRVPIPLVRGAIAEGLYKRGSAVPPPLTVAPPAPGAPIRTLSDAARCYAASHPAEVRALLAETIPGSKKERAALGAMSAGFWQCLPSFAQKRSFNPTQIRYRLAEALLRMPAPTSAVAGQE